MCALIVGPFHSDDAKGSVGLLTASHWRGKQTMRKRSMPKVGRIPTMTANRALLGWLAREWSILAEGSRAEWEAYADNHPAPDGWGGTFIMTGQNAFIRLNHTAVRLDDGDAKQDTPPAVAPPATVIDFTATQGATTEGDIDLAWVLDGTGDAGDFVEIRMAGPFMSQARISVQNRFAFKETVAGNLEVCIVTGLVVGKWYWFEGRYVDLYGQITEFQLGQATPKAGA